MYLCYDFILQINHYYTPKIFLSMNMMLDSLFIDLLLFIPIRLFSSNKF